jgi:hypothetical protein
MSALTQEDQVRLEECSTKACGDPDCDNRDHANEQWLVATVRKLDGRVEELKKALTLAIEHPKPHGPRGGYWHKRDPHVREGCVGCVIEDALTSTGAEREEDCAHCGMKPSSAKEWLARMLVYQNNQKPTETLRNESSEGAPKCSCGHMVEAHGQDGCYLLSEIGLPCGCEFTGATPTESALAPTGGAEKVEFTKEWCKRTAEFERNSEVGAGLLALKLSPRADAGEAKASQKVGCNQHVDCEEADRLAMEKHGKLAFHCDAEDCEDCFGT